MPIDYRPDYANHIAFITGTGQITYADCVALIEAQHADVVHRLHELNDYRGVELELTTIETRRLAEMNTRLYAEISNIRFAVVVDSDFGYGMARVFEEYLDETCEFAAFRDYDEALAWVREAALAENR